MNDSKRARSLFPHGGQRRDPEAVSETLSTRECVAMIEAAAKAARIGKPLNRFITILWQRGGVEAGEAVGATREFLRRAANWIRPKDGPLCWIYVHEGGRKNGAHTHILLHVPAHLDPLFRPMPVRWTKAILPRKYEAGITDTKRVRGAKGYADVSVELYQSSLAQHIHYMLKAAHPVLEAELGMSGKGRWDVEWGQSSVVIGKRTGSWQDRRDNAPPGEFGDN